MAKRDQDGVNEQGAKEIASALKDVEDVVEEAATVEAVAVEQGVEQLPRLSGTFTMRIEELEHPEQWKGPKSEKAPTKFAAYITAEDGQEFSFADGTPHWAAFYAVKSTVSTKLDEVKLQRRQAEIARREEARAARDIKALERAEKAKEKAEAQVAKAQQDRERLEKQRQELEDKLAKLAKLRQSVK